jgi:hypothetical protein
MPGIIGTSIKSCSGFQIKGPSFKPGILSRKIAKNLLRRETQCNWFDKLSKIQLSRHPDFQASPQVLSDGRQVEWLTAFIP